MTTSPSATRTVGECLDALAVALIARGLQAVHARGVLSARNPAGDPLPNHPQARILSPGLCQAVACRPDADGQLCFYWVWPKTRNSAGTSELERLCPAHEVEYAADRISHVIAVAE